MTNDDTQSRLSLTSWLILAAVAAVPPIFATAFSSFEHIKWIVGSIVVGLALVSWGVWILRANTVSVVGGKIAIAAAALGAYALVAVSWSATPLLGLVHASYWVVIAAVYLLLVAPLGRPPRFGEFSIAISMATIGSGFMGILDALGAGFHTVVWDPAGAIGPFDAAEFAAAFYAVALPIVAASVFRLDGWRRILSIVAAVIGGAHFGMVATPITFTLIGIAVGVGTLGVMALQKFQRAPILFPTLGVAIGISALAAVGYFAVPKDMVSDANRLPIVAKTTNDVSSGQIRNPGFAINRVERVKSMLGHKYLAGVASDLFRDNPLIGHGPAGWKLNQTRHPRGDDPFVAQMFAHYPMFKSPHSVIALVAVELGIIGMLLFLFWLGAILGITFKALSNREEPSNWLVEHWGLTCAVFAGLSIAAFTPAFELFGAVIPLAGALAMLSRESALLNGLTGLSADSTMNADGRSAGSMIFGGFVPVAVGLGLVVLAAVYGTSLMKSGYADHQMLRGALPDAVKTYEEAFEAYPANAELLYNIAEAQYRMGKGRDSGDTLDKAIEMLPYDARLHYQRARVFSQVFEYDSSLKYARKSVQLFPNFVRARKQVAIAYDGQKRFTESVKELERILEMNPPEDLTRGIALEMANYYQGALKSPKKELEFLEKAIEEIDEPIRRQTLVVRRDELKKRLERERLQREGKPVPKELMPMKPKDDGHGHGDHGHGGAQPENPFQIKRPKINVPEPNGPVRMPAKQGDTHDHGDGDHGDHDH